MSDDPHHRAALIETARLELDRAHRGALAMDGGEMRRALQLALNALRPALAIDAGTTEDPNQSLLREVVGQLETAAADLADGSLTEMVTLIERARTEIA